MSRFSLARPSTFSGALAMFRRLVPHARLVLPGLAALVIGCAQTIPKHVPATTGPSAQLVMRGTVQPGETYGVYLFQEPRSCTSPEQVGIGTANADPETTTIAANRLSTTEVFLTKPNRTICRVRWSFQPVVGRKYLVAASSTPTGCTARILDATDPHKIVPEPSSRRRDVGPQLCVPMAQTTSLADAASRARTDGESDLPISTARPPVPSGTAPSVSDDDLAGLMRK